MPLLQQEQYSIDSSNAQPPQLQHMHPHHHALLCHSSTPPPASCRYWWLRDIVNFLNFALVASLVYVLATCYLDARAIVLQGTNSSSTSHMASSSIASSTAACFGNFSALQPNQSTAFHAPSVLECSKLSLFPSCSTAADHAWGALQQPSLARADSFAPPAPATQPTLQQQLYSKAVSAVASLSSDFAGSVGSTAINSSSSGSMLRQLRQPRKLLRQVPLLYLWRLWFMGDLFLVSKLGICLGCLAIAAFNPGECCAGQSLQDTGTAAHSMPREVDGCCETFV
jgi:hypothetical protein